MYKQMALTLIGTALLFGSTACGNQADDAPLHGNPVPATASASPTPEVSRTEAGEVRSVSVGTKGDDKKTFSAGNFLMLSPETKFAVSSYSTSTSVDIDGRTTAPAEGEVFHLISYDYAGSTQPYSFAVNISGKVTPAPNDLPTSGVLLVSADEDASISIEATVGVDRGIVSQNVDPAEGVTQSIDAKTGKRTSTNLEIWYKNGRGTVSAGSLTGTGGTSPYLLTVNTLVQSAERTGYVEGKGWANEGEAFISIETAGVDYQMEKHGSADTSKGLSMVLTDSAGQTYVGEANEDKDGFIFTVPLSMDTFSLHAEVSTQITMSGNPVSSVQGLVTSQATISF